MSPPWGCPHQLPRTSPAISPASERSRPAGVSVSTRSRRSNSSASWGVRSKTDGLSQIRRRGTWLAPRAGGVYLRRLRGVSMKIHEYQAKEILRRFGVAVPRGKLATTPEEAASAARELLAGEPVCVVKAQIHAGGRGKGGGVKLAKTPEQAAELARAMLGMQLVTHQTGPQGQKVRKVYVEEGMDIAREDRK